MKVNFIIISIIIILALFFSYFITLSNCIEANGVGSYDSSNRSRSYVVVVPSSETISDSEMSGTTSTNAPIGKSEYNITTHKINDKVFSISDLLIF